MRTKSFDSSRGSYLDKLIWQMRVSKIGSQIDGPVGVIADLGCGHSAPLLRRLLGSGAMARAIGVDLEPAADSPDDRLELLRANLNAKLPIRDASVDVALSLAVLEHLTEPALHLREIRRILKPGGRLLLTTPSPSGKYLLEFLAFRLGVIDRREIEDHKKYYDTAMICAELISAGFDPSRIKAQTFQLGMNNFVVASC
jgi:SAM-dependent methyltransferase